MTKINLVIIIDLTASMSTFLDTLKQVIKTIVPFLSLLRIEKIIIVAYGDYDNQHQTIDKVVQIYENITVKIIDNIKLNTLGSGGDNVEALNSALIMTHLFLQQKNPTPIIIIHDACGYTLDCRCHSDSIQRNLEFKALEKLGIEKSEATTKHIVNQLTNAGHCVTCITSSSCPTHSQIYKDGYCDTLTERTQSKILAALFNMLTDHFNLAPLTQRITKPLKTEDIIWEQTDIDLFRELVLKDGNIMIHLSGLAELYFRAIKKTKDYDGHARFIRRLKEDNVSEEICAKFKESQNESNKIPIDIYQNEDPQGERIICNSIRLMQFLEICTCTSRDPNYQNIMQDLIKSIEIINVSDPRFGEGIPLSIIAGTNISNTSITETGEKVLTFSSARLSSTMIKESDISNTFNVIDGMLLLISFLGRDAQNNIAKVHSRPALGFLMASLLNWCPITKITDIVIKIIKEEDFLQSDKLILSASSYNMTWLLFVMTAFKKIMKKKDLHALYKMWMLLTVLKMIEQELTLTNCQDVNKMTIEAILDCSYGCLMFFCVVIKDWFPICLAVKCDEEQVEEIIKNIKKFNIATDEYCKELLKLCKTNKYLFLSFYAKNFYRHPDNEEKLDPFMNPMETNPTLQIECNESNLHDVYERLVGVNGEHLFTNGVDRNKLQYTQNKICTECRAIYQVRDTQTRPKRRCAYCRYTNHSEGDKYPTYLIKPHIVNCTGENEHKFICTFETDYKIPEKLCPLCNIDYKKLRTQVKCLGKQFFLENIDSLTQALNIPPSVLNRLIETNSAYKTAVDLNTNKVYDDIKSWSPTPFACDITQFNIPKDKKAILVINGRPLIKESVHEILAQLNNHFSIRCKCCDFKKPINEFYKICSRLNCTYDICQQCIQSLHPCYIGQPSDKIVFNGPLSEAKISCSACRFLIKPTLKYKLAQFIFKKKIIITSNGITHNSIADAILSGVPFWRCSNGPECKSLNTKDNYGIFEVPKLECGQEESDHICNECRKYQMELEKKKAEELERTAGLIIDIDDSGFSIIRDGDGKKFRPCPNCKILTERNNGCAHMTCTNCKAHYCYCCGNQYDDASATYTHIRSIFKSIYPSNKLIEKFYKNGVLTNEDFEGELVDDFVYDHGAFEDGDDDHGAFEDGDDDHDD
jgi:hypothetical protein